MEQSETPYPWHGGSIGWHPSLLKGGWKIIRVESRLGKNGKLFTHLTMNKNQDMKAWTYVSHVS